MPAGGLIGMGQWGRLPPVPWVVGDILIHEFMQRHTTADRPDGDIGLRQEAPDPKFPRIRVRFLQVIDLDHPRKPDFAGRPFGAAFVIDQPSKMLRLEAGDPTIDGGTGEMQKAADAHFIPALIGQLDDLEAHLVGSGGGGQGPERQAFLGDDWTVTPQPLGRLMIDAFAEREEEDAGQFPRVKAAIEGLEPIDRLAYRLRHRGAPPPLLHGDTGREEPQHAVLAEVVQPPAHGVGVEVGVLSPLRGCPCGEEDKGTDDLIAPLDRIHEVPLELGNLRYGVHGSPFHCCVSGMWCMYHTPAGLSRANR